MDQLKAVAICVMVGLIMSVYGDAVAGQDIVMTTSGTPAVYGADSTYKLHDETFGYTFPGDYSFFGGEPGSPVRTDTPVILSLESGIAACPEGLVMFLPDGTASSSDSVVYIRNHNDGSSSYRLQITEHLRSVETYNLNPTMSLLCVSRSEQPSVFQFVENLNASPYKSPPPPVGYYSTYYQPPPETYHDKAPSTYSSPETPEIYHDKAPSTYSSPETYHETPP